MSLIANRLFKRYWLYIKEAAIYIINYIPSSINPNLMNPYKRWTRTVNYLETYIKLSIRTLCIQVCYTYIYIGNEKLRPRIRKMIPIVRFGKLYSYEEIYGKVYIVRLDNGKIIRVRDVRFYERDIFGESVEEKTLLEAVFDKETEKFTFRTICFKTTFGSSESLVLQTLMISRFQETEI